MHFQIINPLTFRGYDETVLGMGGSFFHSSNWARVLYESYDYKPLYFLSSEEKVLIPFMEISSPLTGKRGVSLPFTDYCRPIVSDSIDFRGLMDDLIQFGRGSDWKYLELRSGVSLPGEFPSSAFFYGHTLNLSQTDEEFFFHFRDSTKRNIKKGEKAGVEITIDASLKSLKKFYGLNCITRKDHGLPPQPYHFFENIYEHVISKELGHIVLASYEGSDIAGAVFFFLGDTVFYKYGASDRRWQHLRANNLVMWEAMRWYSLRRCKTLCFGRTEPENQGLLQFKKGWGPEESIIHYYKYDLKADAFVEDSPMVYGFHNRIFRSLPMPALKAAGSFLYRHMG